MNYIISELICRDCVNGKIDFCEDYKFCPKYKRAKRRLNRAIAKIVNNIREARGVNDGTEYLHEN